MGSPLLSVIRTLRARVGVTAKVTTSAPSTAKSRSGIPGWRLADPLGPGFDVLEEAVDQLPDLGAAGQSPPARSDQTHQLIAAIDGDQVVVARASHPVDEQGLDVRLHLAQQGVGLLQLVPGLQTEQRLGGPGRTWIEGHDAPFHRAAKEEGHVDRDQQAVPELVRHQEPEQVQDSVADQAVAPVAMAAEQDGAGIAGTYQLPVLRLQEVAMPVTQGSAAEITLLHRLALGDQAAQVHEGRRAHGVAAARTAHRTTSPPTPHGNRS